jgi:RsiW-degrading membrane proteinase PrsW (M82 family)
MGFLFEILFELFGEVIIQVVIELASELGLHFFQKKDGEQEQPPPWKLVLASILFGLLAGAVSLLVFPHSFMLSQTGKLVGLVLVPLFAGVAMMMLGVWRQKRGQQTVSLDRFAYGYIFALAAALVRYYWT